jgi:hypothetical protein
MLRLAVRLMLVLCALALTGCDPTQPPGPETLVQPPQPTSQAELSKMCRPGFYFCPGEVAGCCPNGWGCASTHCIRPKAQTVDRQGVDKQVGRQPIACAPGFYFCPGEVMGCCPNGWGCASTHCIRPPRQRDL